MKKLFLLSIASMALIMPAVAGAVEVGTAAPEIDAVDINGQPFKLSEHKGKTIVLEWTNPECPFVVKHYDSANMQKVQKEALAMKDVEWITINSSAVGKQGHLDATQAKEWLQTEQAAPTAFITDEKGTIGQAYGAQTTPHMFVIDKEGKLAYAGAIDDNPSPKPEVIATSKNYVLAALKNLEAGQPVETATSQPYGCSVKY